jgi:hypothetical protein
MATPGIPVEVREIGNEPGPQGVKVEIAHQFPEVGVLFHHDGFVPVLEEVADTLVAPIVGEGIAGEEAAHELREALRATPEEQMGMVGQEGPGIEGGPRGRRHVSQARYERLTILPVRHDLPSLHAAEDDVVQGPGGIETGLAGHAECALL